MHNSCVCVCECVCARARVWPGVRLFGELTGEPRPSRGRADSAGCRGQPVLQPRPLNQPAPPDLGCPASAGRRPSRRGRACPGRQGARERPRAGGWAGRGRPAPGKGKKDARGDAQVSRYAPHPPGKGSLPASLKIFFP